MTPCNIVIVVCFLIGLLFIFKSHQSVEGFKKKGGRNRGNRVLQFALDNHNNDDTVVMFCHAGIIQHTISCIFESQKLWGIGTKNTAIFEFQLDVNKWSKLSRERFNPTSWRIIRFNEQPHLT